MLSKLLGSQAALSGNHEDLLFGHVPTWNCFSTHLFCSFPMFLYNFLFPRCTTISSSIKLKIWVCCMGKKTKTSRIHASCEKSRRKKDIDVKTEHLNLLLEIATLFCLAWPQTCGVLVNLWVLQYLCMDSSEILAALHSVQS